MIYRSLRRAGLVGLVLAVCSCANTRGSSSPDPRAQWETKITRQNRELEIRLNELEDLLSTLKRDLVFTQEQLTGVQAELGKLSLENRTGREDLQQQVKALQGVIETKTGIIMEEVSKELAQLRRQGNRSSGGRGGEYMRGYEHVVQSGETLSTIASKYGASIDAIADANGLANPNSIRVGQTLFVPAQ